MIVLDTNVLSELMRTSPDGNVVRWFSEQADSGFHITSITQGEILHGILLMPAGKKRSAVHAAAEALFEVEFGGRILAFDEVAARSYAGIAAERRRAGRPISQFDAQIAAIAHAARATVATRNVVDFEGCGVKVVNPWDR